MPNRSIDRAPLPGSLNVAQAPTSAADGLQCLFLGQDGEISLFALASDQHLGNSRFFFPLPQHDESRTIRPQRSSGTSHFMEIRLDPLPSRSRWLSGLMGVICISKCMQPLSDSPLAPASAPAPAPATAPNPLENEADHFFLFRADSTVLRLQPRLGVLRERGRARGGEAELTALLIIRPHPFYYDPRPRGLRELLILRRLSI